MSICCYSARNNHYMPCVHGFGAQVLYSTILWHAWLVQVMWKPVAICSLMTFVCLLPHLLPLNILNYSQSVDSKAIDVCVAWWISIIIIIHAVCTAFLAYFSFRWQYSFRSHIYRYINMFTVLLQTTKNHATWATSQSSGDNNIHSHHTTAST